MASPFLYLKPLRQDLFFFFSSSTGFNSKIPFKTSPFHHQFFLFSPPLAVCTAYVSSRPNARKLLEEMPKKELLYEQNLPLEKGEGCSPPKASYKRNGDEMLPKVTYLGLKEEDGDEKFKKYVGLNNEIKKEKKVCKRNLSLEETEFKIGLDMCSKTGDALGAISLYDSAVIKGLKLQQYHYNVLLYLCSSAAVGEEATDDISKLQNLNKLRDFGRLKNPKLILLEKHWKEDDFDGEIIEVMDKSTGGVPLRLSDDLRSYAITRGFEIYEKMCLEKVPMSEAAMTSVARMAMSMGDGDMAFGIVKQMKEMGITPRLRSYMPAIHVFTNKGNLNKAFEVERHMVESGITPEETELVALLRASVLAGRGEKVYYLLHKLRTIVRQVSPLTADVIDVWFKSSFASRIGKRKWNEEAVKQAVENGGGGWHGLGWLGKGKWSVNRTHVSGEGVCFICQEKLANIDLDPVETEIFAKSVASIAHKREKKSNFEKFQVKLLYPLKFFI